MHRGYIKIWRKIQDWEWWDEPMMFWFFEKLILLANWEDKKWHGIIIKRGQFVTSIESLRFEYHLISNHKKRLKLSTQHVRTFLKLLKTTNELTIEATNKYSLISITNYDLYQDKSGEPTNELTGSSQAANKQLTTTKEVKESKEVYIDPNPKKRKPVFTKPTVNDLREYCELHGYTINPNVFFDYYEANGWVIGKYQVPMSSWKATVRTWVNRENDKSNEPKKVYLNESS